MPGIYKPTSLQGNFDRDNYFEGWFQKIYSAQHRASFIIIYGYATRNAFDKFGFIQLLIPNRAPEIVYFAKDEISCDPRHHIVRMGKNTLSTNNIEIRTANMDIRLNLINNHPIRTFKNTMGYNYYVPSLPCYHSVLNTRHRVTGEIQYEKVEYTLHSETGYLEKNWGRSFPERYFWMHAVDPMDAEVSLLFSQAEIKWLGRKFIKHVGHLHFEENKIDLRALQNCSISMAPLRKDHLSIYMRSKTLQLEIDIAIGQGVLFKGPNQGSLSKDILHHTDALIDVRLSWQDKKRQFRLVGNIEHIGGE